MELTQDQALEQAIVAHREGKLQDAERLYRAILQSNPNHPDANHNLGVLAVTVGKPLDAVPLFKLALEANPKVEQFWLSYTEALIKAERFDEAKRVLSEGEKSGVALEKLELLRQQIPKSPPNKNKKSPRQGLTVSEKRKKLAERKNKKKAQQSKPSAAVPAREQVDSLFAYYQSRRLTELEELAVKLTKQFPAHQIGWKALGIALRETGRLSESIGPTRRSVELRPEDPESHNNLGTTLKELGKLDEAEESYRQAIALKPDFAEAHNNLGVTLYELGRLEEAETANRQAISLKPDSAEAHNNLGNTLTELGKFNKAEASYRQAIALKPDYAKAQNNLGITLKKLGRLGEAEASFRKAIMQAPDYADAHFNLGNVLLELGRLDKAEASLRRAITLQPDSTGAHLNLGTTLYELGRLAEAEASLRQAIALKPDFAEAHSNLGATLQDAGRLEEAEASNRQAIKLKPDFAEAYCNLCDLFLKTNKTDKLLPVLDQARSAISGVKADFLYFEALASFQTEHYEEADTLVAQITDDEVSKIRKAPYYKLVGDLRHRDQDYDAAFFAYESSNQAVKSGLEYKRLEREAGHYFESLKNTARQLEQLLIGSPISERPFQDARQPTFLVGFPRSGTTLLDTILRTHSRVQVIEEQPMVSKMIATLGDLQDVSEIESIDKGRLSVASNAYFEELKKHTDSLEESILVDKLPLNLLHAPLLNQIFPNAKFILSLRHPLDCSLSCWMQNFKLNPAMANMVDLNRIVDFYCVAMEIFKMSQRRYGLNVHSVRYEDLVKDFEGEITSLLGFLGLEWHAGILDYQATAAERERINTPSYSQVIKPIYKTASYRWKYYEKYLDEFKPRLMPWLKEYGYAA